MSIPGAVPITALPSATVPLSGTEDVAIVQGGITKKAPASSIGTTFGGVTSFSAGTTGFAPSSPMTGTVVLSGVLGQANGGAGNITGALRGNGSGVVTQAAASDLSNGVTGSGAVVLATSPALVTPALGVATGTSLALGGASLGINTLAVTGMTSLDTGVRIGLANGNDDQLALDAPSGNRFTTLNFCNNTLVKGSFGWDQTFSLFFMGPVVAGSKLAIKCDGNNIRADYALSAAGIWTFSAPIVCTGAVRTGVLTVATLPTGSPGDRLYVSDATQTMTAGIGAIVAGGGANGVPVFKDSANWRIG